jgi:hypothetical protein
VRRWAPGRRFGNAGIILAVAIFVLLARLAAAEQSRGQVEGHLKISGTRFLKPDGTAFEWRGITAFRLLELVAHGREADADAYLAWAASKKLTVVRVLGMADGAFKLSPADGQHALPRLLDLAQKRGLHVEIVALADTAAIKVDFPRHVKAIGEVCARYPNALFEIANEPVHPTQATALHDAGYLKSLATLVPAGVPVALGSVENGDGFAEGAYVTWHAPRSGGWPAEIAHGAALMKRFRKPLVNDEPMGAGEKAVPGRRDNVPEHFRQAAAASRRAGIGATFHYEGGLQASLPSKIELACLDAWLAGLSAKPEGF